jgi:NAD(P)-dependent dehydrogenase (short-subunit alcohol dehydrogenase family)
MLWSFPARMDRIFVVTGSMSGIGAETCYLLSDLGASVCAVDIKYPAGIVYLGKHVFLGGDVRAIDEMRQLLARVFIGDTTPFVLVNAAGVSELPTPFWEADIDLYRGVIETNLLGPLTMSMILAPLMPRGGVIVNLGGFAGKSGYNRYAAYSGSKGGLYRLSEVMREDLRDYGVRVTTVTPGPTATPMQFQAEPWMSLLSPSTVAKLICTVISVPEAVCIEDVSVKAMPDSEVDVEQGPSSRMWSYDVLLSKLGGNGTG